MNAVPAPGHTNPTNQTAADVAGRAAQIGLKVPSILFEGDEPAAEPVKGSELKYTLSAPLTPAEVPPEPPRLPETYGTGRLWLLAREPHCLYARWDLKPEQEREISAVPAPGFLILRIHQHGEPAPTAAEWKVSLQSRHAFVEVATAGAPYSVELGYYGTDSNWRILARSDAVRTPQEGISAEKTLRFATFPVGIAPGQAPEITHPTPAASPPPGSTAEPAPLETGPALLASAAQGPEQSPPFPPSRDRELDPATLRRPLERGALTCGGYAPEVYSSARSEAGMAWTLEKEEALADLIGWTAPWQNPPGSAEFVQMLAGGEGRSGVGSEWVPPPALPSGVSSFGGEAVARPREFWLNVNAELVVYGSTVPGTRVTIGGRVIQLRPDGTFSYRFALPDGHFELPIVAVSSQGDMRQAGLEFTRGTAYQGNVGTHPQDPALPKPGTENAG